MAFMLVEKTRIELVTVSLQEKLATLAFIPNYILLLGQL